MAKKIKVALIFGGKSGEHEVSIGSATSVFHALDKKKYEVTLIGIDKSGRWLLPHQTKTLISSSTTPDVKLNKEKNTVSLLPFEFKNQVVAVQRSGGASKKNFSFDVVIPILHGPHGEDGTIQGLFELANLPYVGSGVLGSALGMDKEVSRKLFQASGIPVVPSASVKKLVFDQNQKKIIKEMIDRFGLPHFVKPVNMGSSLGVNKVKSESEALAKYKDAFKYDSKILVEKAIDARELECAVLGNHEPRASIVGEIIPLHEFYSYDAKYVDEKGAELKIPAVGLSRDITTTIQNYAIKAFEALQCRGMARVDFFMDKKSGEIFLNEINTIPGFTKISMYPKLWEASGISYSKLIDELVRLAIEYHDEKKDISFTRL